MALLRYIVHIPCNPPLKCPIPWFSIFTEFIAVITVVKFRTFHHSQRNLVEPAVKILHCFESVIHVHGTEFKGTVKEGPAFTVTREFIPPESTACAEFIVCHSRGNLCIKRAYESVDFIFPAKRVIFSLILETIVDLSVVVKYNTQSGPISLSQFSALVTS